MGLRLGLLLRRDGLQRGNCAFRFDGARLFMGRVRIRSRERAHFRQLRAPRIGTPRASTLCVPERDQAEYPWCTQASRQALLAFDGGFEGRVDREVTGKAGALFRVDADAVHDDEVVAGDHGDAEGPSVELSPGLDLDRPEERPTQGQSEEPLV